jgi:hypothetical protein
MNAISLSAYHGMGLMTVHPLHCKQEILAKQLACSNQNKEISFSQHTDLVGKDVTFFAAKLNELKNCKDSYN